MSAASEMVSTALVQRVGAGSIPSAALQQLWVTPIPIRMAKTMINRHHYLHSLPGGTQLAFGVFSGKRLMGALTIGCGPSQAYRLVEGAAADDCATLTRLWLADELPANSESKVIGIVVRNLRRHTSLKFLVSYADPAKGHLGTIYQATGWLYTGLCQAMPLYDLGDGKAYHSRSLSHAYGTHSVRYFEQHGVDVKRVAQSPKHRYLCFLDRSWQHRLLVPNLPYPKKET